MLQNLFEALTNAALLVMLVTIPIEFIVGAVLSVLARVQGQEAKVNPLGNAAKWVWFIMAMQGLIVIGVAVATGTGFQNVVTRWWNSILTWLGQWGAGGSVGGFVGGFIVTNLPWPRLRWPFRLLRRRR